MDGRWLRRGVLLAATVLVDAVLVAACTSASSPPVSGPPADTGPVVVASFNFGESALLAEIYAQALERAGIPVRRELDLGPRELVRPAAQQGLVDVVPEYVGTALLGVDPAAGAAAYGSPDVAAAALRAAADRWQLDVLTPSAAEDRNGFAVTPATARRFGLRTLSDLAPVASRLVLGGATECPQRPLCLPGLERVYGLHFREFVAFDDEGQRATALEQGVIDVVVTFTTDPRLADGGLVLLRDDRHLQPVESVVPIVSDSAVQRYGARLVAALDAVSARLDTPALRFLNWRLTRGGKDRAAEAKAWRERHGLGGA